MEKFLLEKALSDMLGEFGFLDKISVIQFFLNKTRNNIFGTFKENEKLYYFSMDTNQDLDVESLAWRLITNEV